MFRNLLMPAITAMFIVTMTGCEFYFEEERDFYTYCDSEGCWSCDQFDYCTPIRDGEAQTGWACQTNQNCEAGCYCSDQGFCEESDFCWFEGDSCGDDFTCDERDTCVPDLSCKPNEKKPGFLCEGALGVWVAGCDEANPCPTDTGEECVANECVVVTCTAEDKNPGFVCDDDTGAWSPGCNDDNPCPTETGEMCLSEVCEIPVCDQIDTAEMCANRPIGASECSIVSSFIYKKNGEICDTPGVDGCVWDGEPAVFVRCEAAP